MKTKEYWDNKIITEGLWIANERLTLIAAIQHDAQRAAYTQCAEMVRSQHLHSDFHFGHPHAEELMAKKIEAARDKLKLP